MALLALVLVAVVLRWPSTRITVLNEDEALYAAAAATMMETGAPPYVAGVESKPPGIFYLYRAAFALVGRYQLRAVHALTIGWVLLTALLVAGMARRVGPARAGWWAAFFYLVFTTVQQPKVLASQCELLYALPLAGAGWLLVEALAREGWGAWGRALAAGVLCGAATLIKPTAVSLPAAALAVLAVGRPLWLGRRVLLPGLRLAAALGAGFAAMWGAAALYFVHLGVWDDLVYWSFRWTLGNYIPTGFATSRFLVRFAASFVPWAGLCSVLWVCAAAEVRALLGERRERQERGALLLLAWGGFALGMVGLGGRFYDHYFPQAVTPLAALAGLGAARLLEAQAGRVRWLLAGAAAPGVLCLVGALHFDATQRLFGDGSSSEPPAALSQWLAGHTRPQDRIFVWGYYPLIYVGADRIPASRFVGCHYLTGYAALGLSRRLPPELEARLEVPGGFATLIEELERHRAEVVVDTAPADFHGWSRYPLSRYPALAAYLAAHYRREAVVEGAVIYRREDSRAGFGDRGAPPAGHEPIGDEEERGRQVHAR
jgi:4-amino-4-deoxy-L-arabinose transferase-like glycosyltransferase